MKEITININNQCLNKKEPTPIEKKEGWKCKEEDKEKN